ncbi:MAG TPA: ATP-grasp domain-containing protein [Gaiellaceae bacterium]|nr:ATP-grasp domain-containing protein [Gaiellaceae bacterium]
MVKTLVAAIRVWHELCVRLALIACRRTDTNDALARVHGCEATWEPMTPGRALDELRRGDAAVGRLDVLPTLDGMDDGLWALGALAARGVVVLNDPSALLASHDKLLTARLLRRRSLPHPRTQLVREGRPLPVVDREVVLKPRFGSWGREVTRCKGSAALASAIERVRDTTWYRRHGALVQDLVSPQGYDLRVLVAAGRVVGSIFRVAAAGEWRTNVALGGVRRPVAEPPRDAATLAVAAARTTGGSLVGVDLLPDGRGGWTVVEVNGAVEFTRDYAPWGDVYAESALALAHEARQRATCREGPTAAAV